MPTRKVTKVDRLHIAELSAVDDPANQHAMFLLAKSRDGGSAMTIGFDPILVQKGRADSTEPDDEDGGDEDAEDAADQDEDAEDDDVTENEAEDRAAKSRARARSKRIAKHVRGILRRAGLLSKSNGRMATSGSNEPGTDTRSAAEQASDLENVMQAAVANPPAPGKSRDDWLVRVYGDQLDGLDGSELRAATRIFAHLQQATILKRRAVETLETLAKRRAAADPSRTFHQHWRDLAVENPDIYASLRKSDFGVTPPAPVDQGFTMVSDNWGGGIENRGSALDNLNRAAATLRAASVAQGRPISIQKAFVRACEADPAMYQKYKAGG